MTKARRLSSATLALGTGRPDRGAILTDRTALRPVDRQCCAAAEQIRLEARGRTPPWWTPRDAAAGPSGLVGTTPLRSSCRAATATLAYPCWMCRDRSTATG